MILSGTIFASLPLSAQQGVVGSSILHSVTHLLLCIASFAVPFLLLILGRGQPPTVRRAYTVLAGFIALSGATPLWLASTHFANWWGGGVAVLVAAGLWVGALIFLRALPRGLTAIRDEGRTEDIARLRLLDAAVAASGDGVMVAKATGHDDSGLEIVFANAAFERMLGYTAEEAVGLSPSVFCASPPPEERTRAGSSQPNPETEIDETAGAAIRSAMRGTDPVRLELPNRRKDGTRVWAEWHIVPVADAEGRYTHWVAVLRDTTERRQTQDRLRRAKDFLASLLEHIPVPVSVSDAEDRYQLVNSAWEDSVGHKREEVLGRSPAEVLSAPVATEILRRSAAVRATRAEVREEHLVDFGRGPRSFLTVKFPLPGESGPSVRVGAVSLDVTDQRAAADRIRELNAELRRRVEEVEALIELSPVGIAVVEDRIGNTVHMNRVLRELLGVDSEPDLTRTPTATRLRVRFQQNGRDVPGDELPMQRCLARGESVEGAEFQVSCPDGRERILVNSVRPLFGPAGRVRGCVSVYTDITDRVLGERALRDRERLLRNVIENIPCGVFWKDRNSVYLGSNDQVARDRGLRAAADVVGRTDADLGGEAGEIKWA